MKQIVINQNNIYKENENKYFNFVFITNGLSYKVNLNLTKNNVFILQHICKYCSLDYKKLVKNDLINLILNSNCLVVNQN